MTLATFAKRIKLTWLVLGGDPAARSYRVEQFTSLHSEACEPLAVCPEGQSLEHVRDRCVWPCLRAVYHECTSFSGNLEVSHVSDPFSTPCLCVAEVGSSYHSALDGCGVRFPADALWRCSLPKSFAKIMHAPQTAKGQRE